MHLKAEEHKQAAEKAYDNCTENARREVCKL